MDRSGRKDLTQAAPKVATNDTARTAIGTSLSLVMAPVNGTIPAPPPSVVTSAMGADLRQGVSEIRREHPGFKAESDCMVGARYINKFVGTFRGYAKGKPHEAAVVRAMEASAKAYACTRESEITGSPESHGKALDAHVAASAAFNKAQKASGSAIGVWGRLSLLHADQAKAHSLPSGRERECRPGCRIFVEDDAFTMNGEARWAKVEGVSRHHLQMTVATAAGMASRHAFGLESNAGGVNHMTYEEHLAAAESHRLASMAHQRAADDQAMQGTPAWPQHATLAGVHREEAERHEKWALAKAPETRAKALHLKELLLAIPPTEEERVASVRPLQVSQAARYESYLLDESLQERNWTILPTFIERAEKFLAAHPA